MTIWSRDEQPQDMPQDGGDVATPSPFGALRNRAEDALTEPQTAPQTEPQTGAEPETETAAELAGDMPLDLTPALRIDAADDAPDTGHEAEDQLPPQEAAPEEGPRKPRLAFMGEFSAGKSTLTNMLIGADPLPVRVTATQLPPVWLSHGTEAPWCEDLEGNRLPVDLDRLEDLDPRKIRVIRLFQDAEILELCDLIDMPGISDPNMPVDLWQPIANQADMVVWCTHATQAWRQSEAAAWDAVDPALHAHSLLLLTRIDKILTQKDKARVLRRVQYETEGLFADCFPISLTQAIAAKAKDNHEKWERSGAEAFMEALVDRLHQLSASLGDAVGAPLRHSLSQHEMHDQPEVPADAGSRIIPRRVQASGGRRPRAARPA